MLLTTEIVPGWPVVLFDLDGTLANTIPLIVASYQHAFATVTGRQVSEGEARSWIGQTLPATFAREDLRNAARLERVYRTFNDEHLEQMVEPFPGIPELMQALLASPATVGVVTSKRRANALRTMPLADLPAEIPLVGAMEDSATHKPAPGPLLAAVERLSVAASTCVYVGDAVYDTQAAHAAGMSAISVSWGAGVRADLVAQQPLGVADDAAQLVSLLLGGDAAR